MKLFILMTMYHSAPYLREFYGWASVAVRKASEDYEIVRVNDGSRDDSLEVALSLYEEDERVRIIDLSRNFGHHKAMMTDLARRETRLAKVREAIAVLEAEAKAASPDASPVPLRRRGHPLQTPPATAQRNFTHPNSRIMPNTDKAFVQGYNTQATVAAGHQVIVACSVTNQANDAPQALPFIDAVIANTRESPQHLLADAGYWSEANATALTAPGIDPLLARENVKHSTHTSPAPRGRIPAGLGLGPHTPEAPNEPRARPVCPAQGVHRAPVRTHQAGPGLPPIPPPRARQGPGGVRLDLYGAQSPEAVPQRAIGAGVRKPSHPVTSSAGKMASPMGSIIAPRGICGYRPLLVCYTFLCEC